MTSKAKAVHLACSHVDVTITEEYKVLQEVISKYPAVMDGPEISLKEVCNSYKNWAFTLKSARSCSLDYVHPLKSHPSRRDAVRLYVDIFLTHFPKVKGLSITRFRDRFRGFSQAAKHIVNRYFNRIYQKNLIKIPGLVPIDSLLEKCRSQNGAQEQKEPVTMPFERSFRDWYDNEMGVYVNRPGTAGSP